jgi:hypothetical protein
MAQARLAQGEEGGLAPLLVKPLPVHRRVPYHSVAALVASALLVEFVFGFT